MNNPVGVVEYVEPRRFEPGAPDAARFLGTHGYVVFGAVLDDPEVERAIGLLWDYLEALGTGVDRNDAATWTDDRWPPGVGGTGILAFLGIGQSEFLWFVRTRRRVVDAFAGLWADLGGPTTSASRRDDHKDATVSPEKTNEHLLVVGQTTNGAVSTRLDIQSPPQMLTSFDGCCVWRDARVDAPRRAWHHCDQNFVERPGFECVQGFVNLRPVDETTGGNLLVERSHRDIFPRLAELFGRRPNEAHSTADDGPPPVVYPASDYFELPATPEIATLLRASRQLVVKLHPGDLLCWDSRTVHCSTPPRDDDKGGATPPQRAPQLARAVAFVSMVPRHLVSDAVVRQRALAVRHALTSTHWVTKLTPTTTYQTWTDFSSSSSSSEPPQAASSSSSEASRGGRLPAAPPRRAVVGPDVLETRPEVCRLVVGDDRTSTEAF